MLAQYLPVLALAAAAASAFNTTGPFLIHIAGKGNSSIDGYAGACHAGAAIEGLCYEAGEVNMTTYNSFYYDYTGLSLDTYEPLQPGAITWLLPYTGPNGTLANESEPLSFSPGYASNVAAGLFEPAETSAPISFYADNGTFYISSGPDDGANNASYPQGYGQANLTNFHLCWQWTGGYYYHSIAWVYALPPHNPSCQPVDLSMEFVS